MIITLNKLKILAHLTRHYEYEKSEFQDIFINVKVKIMVKNPKQLAETLDYDKLEKNIIKFVKSKQFVLIEEIANEVSDLILLEKNIKNVNIEVGKFGISDAESSSVSIYKARNLVFLALGSNIDDKLLNLTTGINELKKIIQIADISSIYESEALLTEDAPKEWNVPFFNLVLSGYTTFSPVELLKKCQEIEMDKHNAKWGPRKLDIDIIFYDNLTFIADNLVIPHAEYQKRDFVLVPLAEINKNIFFNKKHNLKIAYDKSIWNN